MYSLPVTTNDNGFKEKINRHFLSRHAATAFRVRGDHGNRANLLDNAWWLSTNILGYRDLSDFFLLFIPIRFRCVRGVAFTLNDEQFDRESIVFNACLRTYISRCPKKCRISYRRKYKTTRWDGARAKCPTSLRICRTSRFRKAIAWAK